MLTWVRLQTAVQGMFTYKDYHSFKQHVRDFLVQTKAFAGEDNAALFADENHQLKEVCGNSGSFFQRKLPRDLKFLLNLMNVPSTR